MYIQTFNILASRCGFAGVLKVKSMQRSGTKPIRTLIQPPKPKREITNITNSQNINRTYGQPIEQLFPKRWLLSYLNLTKYYPVTQEVKTETDTKTSNHREPKFVSVKS